MSSQLAEILFKEYRRCALGLLLLQPDSASHVREIARLTGALVGNLHNELSKLAEVGLLVKEPQGKQVYYRANTAYPILRSLRVYCVKPLAWLMC